MKRLVWFFGIAIFSAGCVAVSGGDLDQAEKFPLRNNDPRIGIVRNWGGTHLTCRVRDQAGRPVDLRNRVRDADRGLRFLTDDILVTVDAHGNPDYLWYIRRATLPEKLPAGLGTLYLDNSRHPSVYLVLLDPGRYSIECIPFYVKFWVLSGRERIDKPWRSSGFSVSQNPLVVYDSRSGRR